MVNLVRQTKVLLVWCALISYSNGLYAQNDKQQLQDSDDELRLPFTWTPEWDVNRRRPGYPLLDNVRHSVIQKADAAAGVYHHHPQISFFGEKFYACWSNHPRGEDGPGQRVRFANSVDGLKWSPVQTLFDPLDEVRDSTQKGRVVTALPFVKIGDNFFAVAEVHENTGYSDYSVGVTGEPQSNERTEEFRKKTRRGLGRLVRQIMQDGSLGEIFWLEKSDANTVAEIPAYRLAELENFPKLNALKEHLADPIKMPPWEFRLDLAETKTEAGTFLVEPTTYRLKDETLVRLWREQGSSNRMYAQVSSDSGGTWGEPYLTEIPDAPSKSVTGRLPDGRFFLVGNQVFNERGTRRDPLTIALSKNGLDFDAAFAIRWRGPKLRLEPVQDAKDGRGKGLQYPSVLIREDRMWVIYSVNKEGIDVSSFRLSELEAKE